MNIEPMMTTMQCLKDTLAAVNEELARAYELPEFESLRRQHFLTTKHVNSMIAHTDALLFVYRTDARGKHGAR